MLPRDRAVLVRLARHRVLSLTQLQRLAFAGLHRSRVSRRVSSLARAGWVSTWDDPRGVGGHIRYVVPMEAGLRWALRRIEETTRCSTYSRLIATMLRRDGRQPLHLVRGVLPPFLAHLTEANEALIALQASPELAVTWASSWNRPLPNASHGVALPQPDGVVVFTAPGGTAELAFLEHDRNTEGFLHLRTWDRYRQLAQRPGLLAELTGFRAFRVWVTVRTGDPAVTARRLDDLERWARSRLVGSIFAFVGFETGQAIAAGLRAGTPAVTDSPSDSSAYCGHLAGAR